MSKSKGQESASRQQVITDRIADARFKEVLTQADVEFRPVPDSDVPWGNAAKPVWRVLFTLVSDPTVRFGLDINGEVTLGRGQEARGFLDLTPYGANELGVSREHARLRAEATKLFVLDLGSTNGTLLSGRSIGTNPSVGLAGDPASDLTSCTPTRDMTTLAAAGPCASATSRPALRAEALTAVSDWDATAGLWSAPCPGSIAIDD